MTGAEDQEKKAERLRRAKEMAAAAGGGGVPTAAPAVPVPVAKPTPPPIKDLPNAHPLVPMVPDGASITSNRAGLLDLIVSLFRPKPAAKPAAPPTPVAQDTAVFTIVVAALAGDGDGAAATYLNQSLSARTLLKVKALGRVFQLDNLEDPSQVASVQTNVRHAVAEENADLLIWGEFGKDGYRLRLSTATADDDRSAAFGLSTRLELPKDFAEPVANLLFAAALAAIEPMGEAQKASLKRALPAAATQAEALAGRPPVQMTMGQQRAIQMVFGHVATATAQLVPAEEANGWFDKGLEAYRQAARRLGRTDAGWEAGLIHKHMAAALSARAEKSKEAAPLWDEAIKEWREAVQAFPRALMPQDWAGAQIRLGNALYRLDLLTGQTELLREAITCLQAALQVYSRTETPQRWADIMHTMAQVLEVYGDQLKSTEVLGRAADACRAVLDIRTKERGPLAWAATQNTLGSALFLLDRHSASGNSHLADAEAAFTAALEVFEAHGAKGPAKVAAKNLAHARKLAESRTRRSVVEPHWLDDQE
jgi:tetratricopeptide (TPR) repeat protein